MTVRQINFVLWSAAAAMCIIAAGIGLWGATAPADRFEANADGARMAQQANGSTRNEADPPLESFATIWSLPMRRPLTDSPQANASVAAASQRTATPESSLPVTLVGTIGESLAMLKLADGTIAVKGPGDQVAGIDVLKVRPAQVDVKYQGRTMTLNKVNAVAPTLDPNQQ